jgi:hypothetical protein
MDAEKLRLEERVLHLMQYEQGEEVSCLNKVREYIKEEAERWRVKEKEMDAEKLRLEERVLHLMQYKQGEEVY